MGAWGSGPYDNDAAGDWLNETGVFVANKVQEVLDAPPCQYGSHYDRLRAAAWLFSHVGRAYTYDIYRMDEHRAALLGRLHELRADDEYVSGWKDPARFLADLDVLIERVASPLREYSESCCI